MKWFRPKPLMTELEALNCMLDAVVAEALLAGTPLTPTEREILAGHAEIPLDLLLKTRPLIGRIFDKELEARSDPRSFSVAMMWVDRAWPNIAEVAAQVGAERTPHPLHGWPWMKDKFQLVGCGLLVVLLMLLAVIIAGFVFHWK